MLALATQGIHSPNSHCLNLHCPPFGWKKKKKGHGQLNLGLKPSRLGQELVWVLLRAPPPVLASGRGTSSSDSQHATALLHGTAQPGSTGEHWKGEGSPSASVPVAQHLGNFHAAGRRDVPNRTSVITALYGRSERTCCSLLPMLGVGSSSILAMAHCPLPARIERGEESVLQAAQALQRHAPCVKCTSKSTAAAAGQRSAY